MKKLLTSSVIGGLLLPTLAFAAYNDVTLTSSADIVVDGVTLDVVGDSNVIETITIEGSNFSFVLQNGSTLKVSSATFRQLDSNAAFQYRPSRKCESDESSITHTSTSVTAATITVTVSSKTCPDASSGSGGGSSGSSGGGGGAAATVVASPVVATTGTREAQIASLLSAIAALQTQLNAMIAATPAATVNVTLTINLASGSRGASVKVLQQFLNTHGFVIASSGPGSPGNETEVFGSLTLKAVQKFQEQYGIAGPGVPGYGRVGPKTRAKINEISDQ